MAPVSILTTSVDAPVVEGALPTHPNRACPTGRLIHQNNDASFPKLTALLPVAMFYLAAAPPMNQSARQMVSGEKASSGLVAQSDGSQQGRKGAAFCRLLAG